MAGILASVDGVKLVTDKSWKCTTTPQSAGWASSVFDDKSWPDAVIAGTNTASDIHGNLPQVHASASWIWTSNFRGIKIDGTVYCRGYLGEYLVRGNESIGEVQLCAMLGVFVQTNFALCLRVQ